MNLDRKQFDFLWRREVSLPYGYAVLPSGWRWMREELGENITMHAEAKDGSFAGYMSRGMIDRYAQKVAGLVEQRSPILTQQIEALHQTGQAFVAFSKNLPDPKHCSWDELCRLYTEFFDFLERFGHYMWIGFYMPEAVGKIFEKTFRPKCGSAEEFQSLIRPSEKAGPYQLADAFRSEPDFARRLDIFKNPFRFLTIIDPFWPPFSEEQFQDFVKSFVAPEEIKTVNLPDLTAYEWWLLSFYQNLLYIKDRRDDYRRMAFLYVRPLIDEVARRLEISVDDLSLLFASEVKDFFKDRDRLMAAIAARRRGYIIQYTDDRLEILAGPEAVNNFFEQSADTSIRELQGVAGSAGKVQGRVQILLSTRQVSSFQAGNILVAISTNSPYLPAMQKALAFVTDEGGVTAHAAILARELGKPAVVGTKIATKVLRDGEMVEVDGTKGVVRKVE